MSVDMPVIAVAQHAGHLHLIVEDGEQIANIALAPAIARQIAAALLNASDIIDPPTAATLAGN